MNSLLAVVPRLSALAGDLRRWRPLCPLRSAEVFSNRATVAAARRQAIYWLLFPSPLTAATGCSTGDLFVTHEASCPQTAASQSCFTLEASSSTFSHVDLAAPRCVLAVAPP